MIYMLTVKVSRVHFHRDLSFLGMIVSELTDEMVRVRIKSTLSPYIPLVKVLSFAPSSSGCEQISFAITSTTNPGRSPHHLSSCHYGCTELWVSYLMHFSIVFSSAGFASTQTEFGPHTMSSHNPPS